VGAFGNPFGLCRQESQLCRASGVETFTGPMTPQAFHALFGRIGLRAKLPFPIHPHMLRRGYALLHRAYSAAARRMSWIDRARTGDVLTLNSRSRRPPRNASIRCGMEAGAR
jgi:integrase